MHEWAKKHGLWLAIAPLLLELGAQVSGHQDPRRDGPSRNASPALCGLRRADAGRGDKRL